MFVVYIYVALASYNVGYLTLSMDSVECLVDEAANVAVVDSSGKLLSSEHSSWGEQSAETKRASQTKKGGKGKPRGGHSRQNSQTKAHVFSQDTDLDWRTLWNEGTDAVMDIPLGGVCEMLYGTHSVEDETILGSFHDR